MELAANITPGETEDRTLLAANGWGLVHPHDVAGDPWSYRCYIQASRGEFSCAKPSVVKTAPGWISDRTVCYLASGRPCVVQAAGAEHHLPRSLGLQFFLTKAEAVEALRAVESNYERAAREARRLAEEIFATDIIIQQLIDILGLSIDPRKRPLRRSGIFARQRMAALGASRLSGSENPLPRLSDRRGQT